MAERLIGTVKWFSGPKGFGFISPDNGGSDDLFVHQTEIQSDGFRTLREGQRVEFKVDCGEDGRSKAVNVIIVARNGSGDGVECYNCGRIGHLARDCYRGHGGGGDGNRQYGRGGRHRPYGRGRGGGKECYNCGEEGHFARDCLVEQS